MFQGVLPAKVIAQMVTVGDLGSWREVYSCCSGTFRFERAVLQQHKGAIIRSNDVSLFTSAMGAYLTGESIAIRFKDALAFVEELAGDDFEKRVAAVVVALDMAGFGIGKMGRYKAEHLRYFMASFPGRLEKAVERLRRLREEAPIASFHARDWRDHADEAIEKGAGIAAFPPFFKCLAPEHRLLTADLRWVPCGDLVVGDEILAFEEYPGSGNRVRRWQYATITHSEAAVRECVRVHLENGETIVCTRDHPWLATSPGERPVGDRGWLRADALCRPSAYPTRDGEVQASVLRPLRPWEAATGFDDGWLSGIFDGEGTVMMPSAGGGAAKVSIAQAPGLVADRVVALLHERRFTTTVSERKPGQPHHKGLQQIAIAGGFPEMLRALGTLRPGRLIERLRHEIDIGRQSVRSNGEAAEVRVVGVEPLGMREIQSIATSSRTYVGEGYLMHNSGYERMFKFVDDNTEWQSPTYDIYDPKDLRGILDKIHDAGVPYCIISDQLFPDLPLVSEYLQGRGRPHYVYARTQRSSVVRLGMASEPFVYETVKLDRLNENTKVRIVPCDAKRANYVRECYLSRRIVPASGMANYLVFLDDMLLGCLVYSLSTMPTVFGADSLYLLADVCTHRGGRLSKLLARLALSHVAIDPLNVRYVNRFTKIVTTAFSAKPASMKYRGSYEVYNRRPADDGDGYIINYIGKVLRDDPDEIWRWYWKRDGKKAVGETQHHAQAA